MPTEFKLTAITTDAEIDRYVADLWYKFMLTGGQSFFPGPFKARLKADRDKKAAKPLEAA